MELAKIPWGGRKEYWGECSRVSAELTRKVEDFAESQDTRGGGDAFWGEKWSHPQIEDLAEPRRHCRRSGALAAVGLQNFFNQHRDADVDRAQTGSNLGVCSRAAPQVRAQPFQAGLVDNEAA